MVGAAIADDFHIPKKEGSHVYPYRTQCTDIVTLFVTVFVTTHIGRLAIFSLVERVKLIDHR